MRDKWKLEWLNNARSMEIRMTEQCAMNGKLEMTKIMRDQWKLEWLNNARWMEIRMTKQCVTNGKLEWLKQCAMNEN